MRIAYITSRFPYPVEKGDKLRAYHQIKGLAKAHDVHLFAVSHKRPSTADIEQLKAICSSVHIYEISKWRAFLNVILGVFRGLPGQVGLFYDGGVKRSMYADIGRLQPDHIIAQLIRTSEYVKSMPFTKTLDYMDAFSIGMAQRKTSAFLLRPLMYWEEVLVRKYERRIYAAFDHHTIISIQDRDRLPLPYPDSVRVVGNGVDTDFFRPDHIAGRTWDVLFVGNMGYKPNVEAAVVLAEQIMPLVWNEMPDATLCLAGARPSQTVSRLAGDRVIVTGWIDDIRDAYNAGSILVAPMYSGMGMQNKILEAMAMELPCITTAIVNNAIGAQPGKHLIVGNSAMEMANQILRLIQDRSLRQQIGREARNFVSDNFTWEAQNKTLESLITYSTSELLEESGV